MTRADSTYAITRQKGSTGTIRRVTDTTANPQTGKRTDTVVSTTVRWLVGGTISYSRLLRAQATQQRVGDTEFLIYLPDVQSVFTELQAEDQIIQDGRTFEVISSYTKGTALHVMAQELAS